MRKALIAMALIFLFFSVQAQEFEYPVYTEQPEFDCSSPGQLNKTGMNRVLLDWTAESISDKTCDPFLVNGENGFFCDATQFSIMLSKRIDSLLEEAETELLNRMNDGTSVVPEITSFDSLKELGLQPELDVLLIADNYSEQFKSDFSDHFSGEFLSEKVSISELEFSNSPEESGWFKVKLSGPLYFDWEKIVTQGDVNVLFELDSDLPVLDRKLGTNFHLNPFFELPFDAPLGVGARDYGIDLKGDAFYVNDEIKLKNIDSSGKKLEISLGESFADTQLGVISLFDQRKQDEGELFLSFNPSIPGVLSMHLERNIPHKVYYALSDSQSSPKPEEFYGEINYLLDWRIAGETERDLFPMDGRPNITCTGWQSDINAAEFEAKPTESGLISRHSTVFFPEKTAFSVQCISEDGVTFLLNSYDGESFEFVDGINPVKGEWLANESLLEPNPWVGVFSLSDAVEEFKKGNACAELIGGISWIAWNRSELSSNVVVRETREVDYEESVNDMCRLQPEDVNNITSNAYTEEESKLYWCEEKLDCEAQGGYHFYSPQIEPCAASEQYCCYKPISESEQACLDSADSMEVYFNEDPPSEEFLDKLLRVWNSPALDESRGEEMDLSEAILHFTTEDWSMMLADTSMFKPSNKLNPLVLLAFFASESGMGTNPDFDASRKSIGNIKPRNDLLNKLFCIDNSGDFCRYDEWGQSVRHWAFHIQKNYIDEGIETVDDVLDDYSPDSENKTEEYKKDVKRRVCRWQEMWKNEQDRETEIYAAALAMPDWVKTATSKVKVPKWFTDITPGISKFLRKNIMFWTWDTDNDGIPDVKDKCKLEEETFNDFEDSDGCPDKSPTERRIEGRLETSYSSLRGKKLVVYVPVEFYGPDSQQFRLTAAEFFDRFLLESGLGVENKNILMHASTTQEMSLIKSCSLLKAPIRGEAKTMSDGTVYRDVQILDQKNFFKNLDTCGRTIVKKNYGFVPNKSDYLVQAVVNIDAGIWIKVKLPDIGLSDKPVGGLAELGEFGPLNHSFARNRVMTSVHELGHGFAFAEQYRSSAYLAQAKYFGYIKNYYPGPLQKYYDIKTKGSPNLVGLYPAGSLDYPSKCTYNRINKTNCPLDGIISESELKNDCSGRILEPGSAGEKRSVMGTPYGMDFGFDCYEKDEINARWGS